MEQLLKIGENENVGGEVELTEFEKKLEFARLGFSTAWTTKDGTSNRLNQTKNSHEFLKKS